MNRTIIFYILTCLTGFCNNVFSADPEHIELRADRAKIDELWDILGDETPAGRARADRLFRSGEVGRTPLHIACANRDYKEVKRLIDAGASVHAQEYSTNKTPLCSLVDKLEPGQDLEVAVDIINLLASKGAKIDVVYNHTVARAATYSATPLRKASCLGLPDVTKALLKAGADVNFQSAGYFSDTALHKAQATSYFRRIHRYLIARTMRYQQRFTQKKTTLNPYEQTAIAAGIASRENIDSSYGADDAAQILLDYGADLSLIDNQRLTPLYAHGLGTQVLRSSFFDREILPVHDSDKAELDDEKACIGRLRTKLKKFNPRGVDRETAAKYILNTPAEYMPRQ